MAQKVMRAEENAPGERLGFRGTIEMLQLDSAIRRGLAARAASVCMRTKSEAVGKKAVSFLVQSGHGWEELRSANISAESKAVRRYAGSACSNAVEEAALKGDWEKAMEIGRKGPDSAKRTAERAGMRFINAAAGACDWDLLERLALAAPGIAPLHAIDLASKADQWLTVLRVSLMGSEIAAMRGIDVSVNKGDWGIAVQIAARRSSPSIAQHALGLAEKEGKKEVIPVLARAVDEKERASNEWFARTRL